MKGHPQARTLPRYDGTDVCLVPPPCCEFLSNCLRAIDLLCQASPAKRRYVVLLQDLVGNSSRWPLTLQRLVFAQKHLTNPERFTVMVFLYRNGVDPALIREFFLDCYFFDAAAWRQINFVLDRLENGARWRQWNVVLQRSI